jgi:hypothetical protein
VLIRAPCLPEKLEAEQIWAGKLVSFDIKVPE